MAYYPCNKVNIQNIYRNSKTSNLIKYSTAFMRERKNHNLLTLVRLITSQKGQRYQALGGLWRKGLSHAVLVGRSMGTAIVENCSILKKREGYLLCNPKAHFSVCILREMSSICQRDGCTSVSGQYYSEATKQTAKVPGK